MADAEDQSRHRECALCMESFTSPRLLPCFHTFCVSCLQQLVTQQPNPQMFLCPSCRATITIPPGGVEKFQVNFYIEAETAGQSTARACDICQKHSATHKCVDCDQLACDVCTAIHTSFAATRSHTILQMKTGKDGQGVIKVTRERYCATHKDEKIRFFCNQCSTIICRDCKLTSHEGHSTIDLSAKSSEAKQVILQVTERSRKNLEPKLRQQLREAGDHQKNMQNKKKEILALLEKRAEELKQEVDRSLSQAKQKLDEESDSLDTTIATYISSMDMELAGFLSLLEHAERIAKDGCEADILEMPKQMTEFFGAETRDIDEVDILADTTEKSADKLKSFTDSKWKVVVQMEEEAITECQHCSFGYDKTAECCPKCGEPGDTQADLSECSEEEEATECRHCSFGYDKTAEFCPNCGEPGDTKADHSECYEEEEAITECQHCSFGYDKTAECCPNCGEPGDTQADHSESSGEEEVTECRHCSCRYKKKLPCCPECGEEHNTQVGNCAGNIQCRSCHVMYARDLQNCPDCEAEDVKAEIQRAIPQYIGHVTTTEAEESDSDAQLVFPVNQLFYNQPQRRKATKKCLANQIGQEIKAIVSCLSQWQDEGQF